MNTEKELEFYLNITDRRTNQAKSLNKCLENFNFNYIECIETGASHDLNDGCFGIYLAKIVETKVGIFHSVDVNTETIKNSISFYKKYLPEFNVDHIVDDSVNFLKTYKGSPNLVHLDSWDLDLTNPVPSMLHGWLEFDAIRNKMPSGSIIIIDDNFMKGTWVDWNIITNGSVVGYNRINIEYDIIGKGAMVYHWTQKPGADWKIINDIYPGENIKLILQKN